MPLKGMTTTSAPDGAAARRALSGSSADADAAGAVGDRPVTTPAGVAVPAMASPARLRARHELPGLTRTVLPTIEKRCRRRSRRPTGLEGRRRSGVDREGGPRLGGETQSTQKREVLDALTPTPELVRSIRQVRIRTRRSTHRSRMKCEVPRALHTHRGAIDRHSGSSLGDEGRATLEREVTGAPHLHPVLVRLTVDPAPERTMPVSVTLSEYWPFGLVNVPRTARRPARPDRLGRAARKDREDRSRLDRPLDLAC